MMRRMLTVSVDPAAPVRSDPAEDALAPEAAYRHHRDNGLAEVAQCEAQARRIGFWRLVAFLLALAATTAAYEGFPARVPSLYVGLLAAAALAAFIWLVLRHD